jgi:hypothetical protein
VGNFVEIAQGTDVLPLVMAVERQRGVLGEGPKCNLFAQGEWTGEYYAFPQVRGLLLDLMRRVECGALVEVGIWGPGESPRLPDASVALALVGLVPCVAWCGEDKVELHAGRVVFCSGAEPLVLHGKPDACALVVCFAPMP